MLQIHKMISWRQKLDKRAALHSRKKLSHEQKCLIKVQNYFQRAQIN